MTDIRRDRNFGWERKRVYIANSQFTGLVSAAAGSIFAAAGAAITDEISTTGITAAQLADAADALVDFRPVPADCDVTYPIRFRAYWSSDSSAATDDATIRIRYKAIHDQEAIAAPDTVLDTVIAEDRLGGQYFMCKTAWGILNADTLTDGDYLGIEILSATHDVTIASEFVWIFGYEMEYTPKFTEGGGCCDEAETPNAA